MNLQELEAKVLEWAAERGLLKPENENAQREKLFEEVGEFAGAVLKNDTEQILLEMGDIIVVCINLAAIKNLQFMEHFGWDKWKIYDAIKVYHYSMINDFAHFPRIESAKGAVSAIRNLCLRFGITPEQALEAAYNKIKNRTWKLVGGSVVKDSAVQLPPVTRYSIDSSTIIHQDYLGKWRVMNHTGREMRTEDGCFVSRDMYNAPFQFSTPEEAYESYLKFHGKKQ